MRPSKAAGTGVRACALFLLEYRDRSEAELCRKLRERGYTQNEIEDAVGFVKDCRYVDDESYSSRYIASRSGSRSVRRIRMDLEQRGVPREVIERCLKEYEVDEDAQIRAFLERKGFRPGASFSQEERRKLFAALMRRGYPVEAIRRVMGETAPDEDDDDVSWRKPVE